MLQISTVFASKFAFLSIENKLQKIERVYN
jgi:hypothetical protein